MFATFVGSSPEAHPSGEPQKKIIEFLGFSFKMLRVSNPRNQGGQNGYGTGTSRSPRLSRRRRGGARRRAATSGSCRSPGEGRGAVPGAAAALPPRRARAVDRQGDHGDPPWEASRRLRHQPQQGPGRPSGPGEEAGGGP